ncbi:MAG TPA: prolipoprotein diacylglyceryl transferase [Candidatus Binataceae bacterium]|jgi:phosphatidylglycerol:prolipoprotein diacylglycerol transferase|nr:prolipoprotein diacylglyceryl transferase [Candidatus Binataceae bacterium]
MIPILLRFGPIDLLGHPVTLTIYSYGLMMALGFIAADVVISTECRRRGINPDFATALVLWAAVGGLAGARLYDVLDNWRVYMADPVAIVWSGSGFVWFGGFFGGVIAAYFVARHYRLPFWVTADMAGPALAIGQAFGRIGCLVSGDGDWGLPSTLPWAMSFPRAIVGWNAQTVLKLDAHGNLVSGFFPGVRVHPTPLYEAILYTVVFGVLWSLRDRVGVNGRLFCLYLVLLGACRFTVEFWRVNPRVLWGLSEAQLISAAMVVVGVTALYLTGGIVSGWRRETTKASLGASAPKAAARA